MRVLAVLSTVAIGMALSAVPASAGGPTSVLITSPTESRAVGLYYTDAAYTELQSLLDAGRTVGGSSDHDNGPHLNVTWMVHDVTVWRTDRVLLDAPGGAVVETTMLMDPDGGGSSVRREVAEPARLTALLGSLGPHGLGKPAGRAAPAARQAPLPAGAPGRDARWEWGIGGVLVGLLAAALLGRVAAVRAGRVRAAR